MSDTRPARGFERKAGKCGGRATIQGTRIEPQHIKGRIAAGDALDALCREYPDIPRADFEACLTANDEDLDWLPLVIIPLTHQPLHLVV